MYLTSHLVRSPSPCSLHPALFDLRLLTSFVGLGYLPSYQIAWLDCCPSFRGSLLGWAAYRRQRPRMSCSWPFRGFVARSAWSSHSESSSANGPGFHHLVGWARLQSAEPLWGCLHDSESTPSSFAGQSCLEWYLKPASIAPRALRCRMQGRFP